MRVAHVTTSLSHLGAGVTQAAWDFAGHERKTGVDTVMFGVNDPFASADIGLHPPCPYFAADKKFPRFLYRAPELPALLARYAVECDLVHHHGLWLYPGYAARVFAARHRLPRVVSIHGALSAWAMKYRSWKKWPAWICYERENLVTAACLHATCQEEAVCIRRMGVRTPIAVIPLGLELPLSQTKDKDGSKTVLFMSRIHRSKGLPVLLQVWSEIAPRFPGWQLVIAGPDENGHQAELERLMLDAGLTDRVKFIGPVHGAEKQRLLAMAELFVLPSYSENFGIVVAEALAASTPVITTRGTPWRELETQDCGWWTEMGAKPLATALDAALSLSVVERIQRGQRGRRLIEDKYAWPTIIGSMTAVYDWILRGGPVPACVEC